MATATREAYGKTLAKLIVEHDDLFVLDADLTKSTKTIEAKKARPEHHFNMGIAEGNMMAVAAGMAASNKVVYASSFAMFAAGRAFEQIRNSICYPNLNVKVCATHAGISVGEDGASHQCIEDLALMRSIPNMKVFQPCDANYKYEFGKGNVLKKGNKVAIIASGLMVQESLKAYELLENKPTIIDIPTIKPIDKELIIETAKTHDVIVTVEEHNIYGGLGSAVSEVLAPEGIACRQYMLGMQDAFGRSGKPKDLLDYYGLDAKHIAEKAKEIAE